MLVQYFTRPVLLVLLATCCLAAKVEKSPSGKVIYGNDDRKEPYTITDPNQLKLIQADVAIVFLDEIAQNVDGTWRIISNYYYRYGSCDVPLCSDEPFSSPAQRLLPFCSGFLMESNETSSRIATAGHCIEYGACDQIAFIFDYKLTAPGTTSPEASEIPEDNVYLCSSFQYRLDNTADWAVVELDRPVVDREALPLRQSGDVEVGTPLVMVGHPAGLPMKVDGGATVKDPKTGATYFTANTDSYGGNSGSMVVNSITWEVEGILVRGNQDYVLDTTRNCCKSNVCSDTTGCDNTFEEITKVSEILDYVSAPLCNCKSESVMLKPTFLLIFFLLGQFFTLDII